MSRVESYRDHARRMAKHGPPQHRELWTQLADEADDYLTRDDDPALFEAGAYIADDDGAPSEATLF